MGGGEGGRRLMRRSLHISVRRICYLAVIQLLFFLPTFAEIPRHLDWRDQSDTIRCESGVHCTNATHDAPGSLPCT